MTRTPTNAPFFRSFLLGKTFSLDDIKDISDVDLETLNIETLTALNDARHEYSNLDDRQSKEGGQIFYRMKVAGYFQSAIQIEKNSP